MQVTFTDQKLRPQFNVKDRTKFENKNDIIYFVKCPEQNCTGNYLGESGRRVSEQILDHGGSRGRSSINFKVLPNFPKKQKKNWT